MSKSHRSAFLVIALSIASGCFLLYAASSQAGIAEHWVTVDSTELEHITSLQKSDSILNGIEVRRLVSGIAVLRLNDLQMEEISRAMHDSFQKCSGFIAHQSEEEAIDSVESLARVNSEQQFVTYSIDNQAVVTSLLAETSELQNRQVILDLSAFPNRRYNQPSGMDSATWIKNKWTALAAGRSDTTVEFYNHPTATSPQPSIIMTIQGTTLPDEIVVLGAHQDSINGSGSTLAAPGADDDASGIACLTETIRVMMAKNFRPNRTIKFMAYAAEEVGLRGSNAIATAFRAANINVVGVIQLDMTNYKGTLGNDIVIFQDYSNVAQNEFVTNLITTYQPTLTISTSSCGYGCSDHASWYNKSYPASFPFEATINDDNSAIHTANDTISRSNNNADHALKFTKLALSYVGELAKGTMSSPRNVPFDFDGDSKVDPSVFRPANGVWYLNRSQAGGFAMQFGVDSDRIAPADYDGDGKTDVAVYRPSQGVWYIYNSGSGTYSAVAFGLSEDIPAPADFDGDGRADIAVFRPSTGTWWVNRTTAGLIAVQFGSRGDIPSPGDFDGDRKADMAVYRPTTGSWYERRSAEGDFAIKFGDPTDRIVPADYDGDGKMDVAVYRPSQGTWYIVNSSNGTRPVTVFGLPSDIPTPGDYDGDGKAELGLFRPSDGTWWINRTLSGLTVMQYGANGDRPTPSAFAN